MAISKKELAAKVLEALAGLYPQTGAHLSYNSPWELLVATVLAAQCTDARVNQVTPALFGRFPTPAHFAAAEREELEELIHSTGFYRNKAKHLVSAAQKLVNNFGGEVPRTLAELVTLDGVARKTANVVLNGAFGINEGLAVDTHVGRISLRLGLTASANPVVVERDLMKVFPREEWGNVNHRMVSFGRDVCDARCPRCGECPMRSFCPREGVKKSC